MLEIVASTKGARMNSPKTLRLKTTFGFWSVFVMILGLLACNSSPTPNQQTPKTKPLKRYFLVVLKKPKVLLKA
jgi:hypothetical protein